MIRYISVLLFVLIAGQGPERPPAPYEDWGVCPREYCAYGRWTAEAAVNAHAARSSKSPVVFSVQRDQKVTADTGVLATTSAGIVVFSSDTQVGTLKLRSGDKVYLLTYEGEGLYRVWFKGRSYSQIGPICDETLNRNRDCIGRILKRPDAEWWARIKNTPGQVGWVEMSYQHRAADFIFDSIPRR